MNKAKPDKIEELAAWEIGQMVNDGRLRPTEIIEYFFKRIEERNSTINAFVYTMKDYALSQAEKLEKRLEAGEYCGPFAGVPFALKDFLPSKKGWTNTHGGVKCMSAVDEYDSVFCQAMEELGGIAIGKTNAPAFGFRGTTDNKMYGPTGNPYNPLYNAGGSSGGSAAAVADGLVTIAEGGDAGGSIRIPAAWCSLVGFKASAGLIPNVCRPDAWSATHPYCVPGGLTKSVKDSAILLGAMSRYSDRDPLKHNMEKDYVKELQRDLHGMKVALTYDFDIFPVDPEIREAVARAAKAFEAAGAEVSEVHFNFKHTAYEMAESWCRAICIDTAIEEKLRIQNGVDLVKEHREDFPEEFIYWNHLAMDSTVMDYYDFHLIRTEVFDEIQNIFDDYDLLISPVTSCNPVKNTDDHNTLGPVEIEGVKTEPLIGYTQTFLYNFSGNPACSVPCGFTKDGLPIGLQIAGRRFKDEDVLLASEKIKNALT